MNFKPENFPLYLITGQPENDEKTFLQLLEKSLKKGIKLIQIRAKSLSLDDYKKLAHKAIKLCHDYHAIALISQHVELIEELNADGIHLPSPDLMKLAQSNIPNKYILSVACHNKEQVLQAEKIGADIAVISPIFATPSSPQGKPLGWENFSKLAALSTIPVYALGGVTPVDLPQAKSHGAVGIAAIRSIWGVS